MESAECHDQVNINFYHCISHREQYLDLKVCVPFLTSSSVKDVYEDFSMSECCRTRAISINPSLLTINHVLSRSRELAYLEYDQHVYRCQGFCCSCGCRIIETKSQRLQSLAVTDEGILR